MYYLLSILLTVYVYRVIRGVQIMAYKVFHRTWWKNNPEWPDGLEP